MLADRVARLRLLAAAVVLWSVASVVSAFAVSYPMLLLTRLGLGAVVALAGPAVASLTGDLFPPQERARVYGFILSGELLGAGIGFAFGGTLAGALGWRAAFAWLALPGLVLAWALVRFLDEPARDGADRLPSVTSLTPEEDALHEQLERRDVAPVEERILREEPERMGLGRALRWILSIPTNRSLIVSSALGYFFFAGVQTFAVVFLRHRYGLGQATASLLLLVVGAGSVVGALAGGRVAASSSSTSPSPRPAAWARARASSHHVLFSLFPLTIVLGAVFGIVVRVTGIHSGCGARRGRGRPAVRGAGREFRCAGSGSARGSARGKDDYGGPSGR